MYGRAPRPIRAEYSHWHRFDCVPLNVLEMYHFLTDSK